MWKANESMVAIFKKKEKNWHRLFHFLFLVKSKVSQDCFIIMQNFLSSHHHLCTIKFIISWNKNDFFEFIIAVSSDKYAVIFWSWSTRCYIKIFFPSGWTECDVVQFYPWIKFYFLLFQTHYHTLPYTITKENEIQTKDKLNHNKYTYTCIINHYTYTFPQVDSVVPA